MISLLPDDTLLIQWAIFLLVLGVLHFGGFRPTLKILRERKKRTKGEKERAQILTKEAEKILVQYEEKIKEARLKGNRERERLSKEGEAIYSQLVKEARSAEEEAISKIRQDLESQKRQAMIDLEETAQEMSKEIARLMLAPK
ncbi:MAG: hypothetical protein A3F89_07050 [Deltaproteobacteria bacterium RIFCSPLOWO2_12_FULL_50_11]|nr:MAG: hypothetical protein A3F89_07050 [Deltaproteobacteria bacterium RIFCSPLOWO2_12_FULL_50_11]